jgi:hypothetical protein
MSLGPWWNSEYTRFIKDTFWTLFVFAIVALAAFGLQKIIEILEANGAKPFIIYVLTLAEYYILFVDTLYLVISVARHLCIFAISCWREVKAHKDGADH